MVDHEETSTKTKLTVERRVTTCFAESLDWRDTAVGDAALVRFGLGEEDFDMGEAGVPPEEIDADTE